VSGAVTASHEGVAVAPGPYTAQGAARPRYAATIGVMGLVLAVAVLIVTLWDRAVADETVYACPPDCGRPPIAAPVANLPRFVAAGGEFSVAYPPPGSGYAVDTTANGVTARLTGGDGGLLRLFSEPANGRDARQVVEQLLARQFPNADVAYELPNATVGYQLGYGVVANFQPPGLSNRYDSRAIVIAAVKNDLALVATGEGPYRRFSPDFGPGPPSGANVEIAIDMGQYVESFSWRGDPPR
jgi:hypothetical protein